MINKTRAVLENTMVVFCQAQVSDIFIYCQARVLDTDPTFSCTLTADTDTPADDQQDTIRIIEYYGGVSGIILCQAQVLDKYPTLSCTVTADTDTPADDQLDTVRIIENTMVFLVKSSFVKLRSLT